MTSLEVDKVLVGLSHFFMLPDPDIKLIYIVYIVFFNLGSTNSVQGSSRILKLALFLVSRFRLMFNNVFLHFWDLCE